MQFKNKDYVLAKTKSQTKVKGDFQLKSVLFNTLKN